MARLLLAPMEGTLDEILRDVLTSVGGYDRAVTEFLRVTGTLLPARAFFRNCPELANAGCTSAGTPVVVQLLGSDPVCLAENAGRLAELAPAGIDLNFGCPAPTVNRHGGGAALLADPDRVFQIVCAVRRAVPSAMPVTAKMRLGVRDTARTLDCARAIEAGGAVELVVHARTGAQRYRPPAYWEWIASVREVVRRPVVANGEVWTVADHAQCRLRSGCADVMLARGAVADPFLARRIAAQLAGGQVDTDRHADWLRLQPLLASYWQRVSAKVSARHAAGRLKLWLGSLRRTFVAAEQLFLAVHALQDVQQIERVLAQHGVCSGPT